MGPGSSDVSEPPQRAFLEYSLLLPPIWRQAGLEGRRTPVGRRIIPVPTATSRWRWRRLTRVHVRSVEQPVNLDDGDDVFNWPWLVAGEMGDWKLTESQAKTLREYLLRGGFLMLDEFLWGPERVGAVRGKHEAGISGRPSVEIDKRLMRFSTRFTILDDRYQILASGLLAAGRVTGSAETVAQWKGIYDDPRPPDGGHVVQPRTSANSWSGRMIPISGKILGAGNAYWR